MRVLITGIDGYIGSLMGTAVAEQGHEVTGLDTGYFRDAQMGAELPARVPTMDRDLRHITRKDLEGFEAVIHLAGLSNDALGEISSRVTHAINHEASARLARLCKQVGVSRFLYASSCSVYGRSHEDVVTEQSAMDPQTDYARCKMLDEGAMSMLADDSFSPTFLRNATAYGASPRMRFDLVVNNLAGLAWTTGKIAMTSDGTPWRPIVHVLDICRAFIAALAAPREQVHGQIFNVGRTDENFRVREIAEAVAKVFPECSVSFGQADPDQRSYRVSFDKIHLELPGFHCDWTLERGVTQLRALFEEVALTEERFRFRAFTRLSQLKHLIDTKQIDADFFWTTS